MLHANLISCGGGAKSRGVQESSKEGRGSSPFVSDSVTGETRIKFNSDGKRWILLPVRGGNS